MAVRSAPTRSNVLVRGLNRAVAVFATLAVVSLALEYGFHDDGRPLPIWLLDAVQWSCVLAFVLAQAAEIATAVRPLAAVRAGAANIAIIVLGALLLLVQYEVTHQPLLKTGTIYVATLQVLIVARLGLQFVKFNIALSQSRLHPARIMVVSFAIVIVAGTLLLVLPKATHGPGVYTDTPAQVARHWLKCLFTATSATCVTGLVTYDTSRDFTLFGQAVILVLIQLGGLGIMIFGTVFGLLLGRQLSLRESQVLQDALSHETLGTVARTVKFVCIATLVIESFGAVALYRMWDTSIESVGLRWFYSVFHAVSAFCNAGFALQRDSLVSYRGEWQVYGIIMPLIVFGGLGFPVLQNLWAIAVARVRRLVRAVADRRAGRVVSSGPTVAGLTLHSKLVLSATAVLIIVPAVLLYLFETPTRFTSRYEVTPENQVVFPDTKPTWLSGMPAGERALAALFQSVTTRTAGFNTVELHEGAVSTTTHFLMCVLMFVGGAPGSTAGGVKVVTMTVLLLGVVATLRGRPRVEAFSRTLAFPFLRRAAALVIVMGVAVSGFVLLLCYTEPGSLREVLFETVSACGTVGLSAGLTPRLTDLGQGIIILAMFAGRLGPLTLLIALAGRERSARYEYPEEPVIIG